MKVIHSPNYNKQTEITTLTKANAQQDLIYVHERNQNQLGINFFKKIIIKITQKGKKAHKRMRIKRGKKKRHLVIHELANLKNNFEKNKIRVIFSL